jgi:hypothetical protein
VVLGDRESTERGRDHAQHEDEDALTTRRGDVGAQSDEIATTPSSIITYLT